MPAGGATGTVLEKTSGADYATAWTALPTSLPPSGAAGGDLTGTYPNPSVTPAAKSKWTDTGTTLTPVGPTRQVVVPGPTATGADQSNLVLGSGTIKTRLAAGVGHDVSELSNNRYFDGSAYQRDNTSKPAWSFGLDNINDAWSVTRTSAAGAAATLFSQSGAGVLAAYAPSNASLLLLDATGQFTLPTNGANNPVIFGARTIKGRLVSNGGSDLTYLSTNAALNVASTAWIQDDVTKPSWLVALQPGGGDAVTVMRILAGGTSTQNFLTLDNSANLTILGSIAIKASGTTWANPSDPRLKQDIAPYDKGLAEVVQLDPITYRLKADPTGQTCYGFDAAQVKPVFPECVSETRTTLPGDTEPTDGVLSFDMHPILVALVNAVKELTARVAALEATSAAPDPTPA